MKIKACAFRFSVPAWANLKEFLVFAASLNNESVDGDSLPVGAAPRRFLHLEVDNRFTYGLNIYGHERRRFYKMKRSAARKPEEITLTEEKDMAEFNFFFIDNVSGRGVITHYRGCGTSLETFGFLLKRRFRDYKAHLAAPKPGQKPKKLPGVSRFSRLIVTDPWQRVVRNSDAALQVHLRYDVPEFVQDAYRPAGLKYATMDYVFKEGYRPGGIPKWIERLFKNARLKPKSGSVRVMKGDNPVSVTIGPTNFETIHHWDYDAYAPQRLDVRKWRECDLAEELAGLQKHDCITIGS